MKFSVENVTDFLHCKAFHARRAWQDFGLKHGLIETRIVTAASDGKIKVLNKTEEAEFNAQYREAKAQREASKNAPTP